MAKKLSARELSLAIGQNPNYINLIESKKNYPSIQALNYICEHLGITLEQFFNTEQQNPPLINDLLHEAQQLNEETIIKFIELMKAINKTKS